MFDADDIDPLTAGTAAGSGSLDATVVEQWTQQLMAAEGPTDDASRIDVIRALEVLDNGAAAAQASVTRHFDRSQRSMQATDGAPAAQQGRGVALQLGLARRESHHHARQHLALATTLPEMPHTAAAFAAGRITEWRAQLLLRETACLTLEHRQMVDEELAGDPERLEGMGP